MREREENKKRGGTFFFRSTLIKLVLNFHWLLQACHVHSFYGEGLHTYNNERITDFNIIAAYIIHYYIEVFSVHDK